MILNSGLDEACVTRGVEGGGAAQPHFCRFITYAAFGTGSSTPDAGDTSLDAQVGNRTNSRGGFSDSDDGGQSGTTIWYEATFTRVFTITSNVNATEWGLAAAPSGPLSVRDLFRADPNDPLSSPITLTLEDGDQLQLVITFRVEATWEYQTKSFVITGTAGNDANGTHAGDATVTAGASSGAVPIRNALAAAWPGGANVNTVGGVLAWLNAPGAVGEHENMPVASLGVTCVDKGYTPGTHYRDWDAVFSPAQGNGDHYAWMASDGTTTGSPSSSQGYRFLLTDPPYLTKQNTHRLTLTLRKSISRL